MTQRPLLPALFAGAFFVAGVATAEPNRPQQPVQLASYRPLAPAAAMGPARLPAAPAGLSFGRQAPSPTEARRLASLPLTSRPGNFLAAIGAPTPRGLPVPLHAGPRFAVLDCLMQGDLNADGVVDTADYVAWDRPADLRRGDLDLAR